MLYHKHYNSDIEENGFQRREGERAIQDTISRGLTLIERGGGGGGWWGWVGERSTNNSHLLLPAIKVTRQHLAYVDGWEGHLGPWYSSLVLDQDDVDNDLHEAGKHDEDDWSEELTHIGLPRPPLQRQVLQKLQRHTHKHTKEANNMHDIILFPHTSPHHYSNPLQSKC